MEGMVKKFLPKLNKVNIAMQKINGTCGKYYRGRSEYILLDEQLVVLQ